MSPPVPPPGYRLAEGAPEVEDYLRLRERAGLSPRREDQARAALAGGWAAVHVVHETDGPVGMGRVLGDGGWYFHVVDMAVLPGHRRRGLGNLILATLARADPRGRAARRLRQPPRRRARAPAVPQVRLPGHGALVDRDGALAGLGLGFRARCHVSDDRPQGAARARRAGPSRTPARARRRRSAAAAGPLRRPRRGSPR